LITINQTETTLELTNRVSPGLRVFIFVIGLIPLLAPYELLFKVKWNEYFNLAFLFALAISLGALTVTGFFIFFALMAFSRRLNFDLNRKVVIYGFNHALQPYREELYDFEDFAITAVEEHDSSDGPASYSLVLYTHGGSDISIGYFNERTQADYYRNMIESWIGSV
jgi:hypothetical protein